VLSMLRAALHYSQKETTSRAKTVSKNENLGPLEEEVIFKSIS